jgi:hypothetical protein
MNMALNVASLEKAASLKSAVPSNFALEKVAWVTDS